MKSLKLLILLALFLAGITTYSQNLTIQVAGHVINQQTGLPVPNHLVAAALFPDSINYYTPFSDTALTDPTGAYLMSFVINHVPGTVSYFTIGTPDCINNWIHQSFVVTGNQTSFTSDFMICGDTIIPPSPCQNSITISSIQNLTVNVQGNMVNGQSANYIWSMGDGTTSTGQNITHTYSQPGYYLMSLNTITANGCSYVSSAPLMLMDSTNTGCSAYFVASATSNPKVIDFTAVSQNTNPMTFTWQFGDGTAGTGQNIVHPYCCPGTYTVMLTSSDNLGCTSTYIAPVLVYPDSVGNLTVHGQVFAGNSWLNAGIVTLFSPNASGNYYPVQSVPIDSVGFYHFWNVNEGTYIILASPQPDPVANNLYLPTFYGNVVFWEQATPIVFGTPQNPYNIYLVPLDSIGGGNGYVGGQIIGGGKSMVAAGQEVLLLDMSDNPIRITYTNAQGIFSFASLPYGEYQVNPMVTGATTIPQDVNLDATNPTATVVMTMNGNTITGVTKAEPAGLIENIYPNPAINEILVTCKMQVVNKIQIVDASGKVVFQNAESVVPNGNRIKIPVSELKPGLYILLMQDKEGNTSSKRFVKK